MNLSEDTIVEILSRLPVRSLIRFKCVCKSWYVLISDPNFITKTYRTISIKESSRHLLVSRRDNVTNKRVISILNNDENDAFVDQDFPPFLNDSFGHIRLIGPCNGIICLYGFPDNIALWNPVVRDFKILPSSQVLRPPRTKVRGGDIGIGFDSKTNDFKVIQILFCVSNSCHLIYQVEIFSLKTNSWRKHESCMPANIMYYNIYSMVYKNETFCWWAQDSNGEVILSFDVSKEIFQKTPLPSEIEVLGGQNRTTRAILPLKESIALIVYPLKEVDKIFKIWVMDELNGNGGNAWTKVLSIGPLSKIERPLGFWNDGECIFESSCGELVLYNPSNKEIKNLGVYGKRNRLEVVVHKESLFLVNRAYANL